MKPDIWADITARINSVLDRPEIFVASHPLAGGDTCQAYRLETRNSVFFVKLSSSLKEESFAAEAAGLDELAAVGAARCPRPLLHGHIADITFLVLEHIRISRQGNDAVLGSALAQIHRHTAHEYGWDRGNTIGRTPQDNRRTSDWATFWRDRRLLPQLKLAAQSAAPKSLLDLGERLLAEIPALLRGHRPEPSLLHGDLWGSNHGYDDTGRPVLFDPAVYYGDRETDIAMTQLFGGFGADFLDAYHEAWPLPCGHEQRRDLYNLYHVLNHYNLFGASYAGQASRMIDRLLASAS